MPNVSKLRISVITPSYNNGEYISNNIKTIANQTYKNIEHIVVDGGSKDNTLKILENSEVKNWISEPDKGMYDAINKGIKKATGDIICYLNVDDRFYENTLEIVAKYFSENSQLDFVYGECGIIDCKENPVTTFRSLPFIPTILNNSKYITWFQATLLLKLS